MDADKFVMGLGSENTGRHLYNVPQNTTVKNKQVSPQTNQVPIRINRCIACRVYQSKVVTIAAPALHDIGLCQAYAV